LPSTVTAEANVALKESPGELIFDPTEFPNLTVRVVPAGTTTGCGSGAFLAAAGDAGEPMALPPAVFEGAAAFWLAASEVVSDGFFEQAASVNNSKMDNAERARERMIFPSEIKICCGQNCNRSGRSAQTP
jgi:hypothetical protein